MLPFRLFFHPAFNVDLGTHVFPAQKYRLVRERLVRSGLAEDDDFVTPAPVSDEDVLRVHTPEYVRKLKAGDFSSHEALLLEVPWSASLVEAMWICAGADVAAARAARRDGCAVVLGGGFHHAFRDHGEGFCLIHDVAVATAALRDSAELDRIAVLDLDVHQGNGTAAILGSDPRAFTVSLHQQNNYPGVKPPSHLDVGLPDGTGDAAYLAALEAPLAQAIGFRPDVLWYLAGADPYAHDLLGGLGLSIEGLRERDGRVLDAARAAGVPVVVTLAGGYAADTDDTVTIHANTVRVAAEVFAAGPRAGRDEGCTG